MEFKTGELEARLNRKEQMIAKLENDLREVWFCSVVVFFLLCFRRCYAKYTRDFGRSRRPSVITREDLKTHFVLSCPGFECSVKLCTDEYRDATSSGN